MAANPTKDQGRPAAIDQPALQRPCRADADRERGDGGAGAGDRAAVLDDQQQRQRQPADVETGDRRQGEQRRHAGRGQRRANSCP